MWSLLLGLAPGVARWLAKVAPWLAAGLARELQQRQQRDAARRTNQARTRQVDAAIDRPATRDDLVRRLRDKGSL